MIQVTHKYDDIIDLPHHVSDRHPQMPLMDRAAQFSPFAALMGYDSEVSEAVHLTDSCLERDEDTISALNERMQILPEWEYKYPEITVE